MKKRARVAAEQLMRDIENHVPDQVGFIEALEVPSLTQLDMTAPYDVLARVPQSESHLIWKSVSPVKSELGLTAIADTSFADCPPLDLLCVPAGAGINLRLTDTEFLRFLREAALKRAG